VSMHLTDFITILATVAVMGGLAVYSVIRFTSTPALSPKKSEASEEN
jgi:hypothetical protein